NLQAKIFDGAIVHSRWNALILRFFLNLFGDLTQIGRDVKVPHQDLRGLVESFLRPNGPIGPDVEHQSIEVNVLTDSLALHIKADAANGANDRVGRDLVDRQAPPLLARRVASPLLDGHFDL